jgi:hypothetical protein
LEWWYERWVLLGTVQSCAIDDASLKAPSSTYNTTARSPRSARSLALAREAATSSTIHTGSPTRIHHFHRTDHLSSYIHAPVLLHVLPSSHLFTIQPNPPVTPLGPDRVCTPAVMRRHAQDSLVAPRHTTPDPSELTVDGRSHAFRSQTDGFTCSSLAARLRQQPMPLATAPRFHSVQGYATTYLVNEDKYLGISSQK